MHIETQDNATQQDAAPAEPSVEDEFDAAFAELDGAEDAPADKAAVDPKADEDDDSAEDDTAPASDDAAASEQPAADAPGSDQSENDPWANAPADLRERHETEKRDYDLRLRSSNGRVSALDRKVQELTRQLEEARKGGQNPEATQQGDGEGGGDDDGKAGGKLSDDALSQLREDYPDLAGPLIDMLEKQGQTIQRLSQGVGAFEQTRESAAIAEQENLLTQEHPDWQEVAADDRFAGWIETQPKSIQDAMARNFEKIVDGADAALVIGRFKESVGKTAQADPNPQPSTDPKRERQLQGGRDTGRTGPSSKTGIAKDDFDGAVAAFLDD